MGTEDDRHNPVGDEALFVVFFLAFQLGVGEGLDMSPMAFSFEAGQA
jgi:hypothetical protein